MKEPYGEVLLIRNLFWFAIDNWFHLQLPFCAPGACLSMCNKQVIPLSNEDYAWPLCNEGLCCCIPCNIYVRHHVQTMKQKSKRVLDICMYIYISPTK